MGIAVAFIFLYDSALSLTYRADTTVTIAGSLECGTIDGFGWASTLPGCPTKEKMTLSKGNERRTERNIEGSSW